jgi:cyclase
MQPERPLPANTHFKIEQLAPGVYAAIAQGGGGATGNAGIIDLGDRTLIFDTFETPLAAAELRAAAELLTGRAPATVINSHAHPDHWFGNQVFEDCASIIATEIAREEMPVFAHEIEAFKQNPAELVTFVDEERERLSEETEGRGRAVLQASIARWEHVLDSLAGMALRLPDQTFDSELALYGSQRSAELYTLGDGHTAGDCFLVLPEDKIAFIGDLGFFQGEPFMLGSHPQGWLEQLETLIGSEIERFVPGHGPVGGKEDLELEAEYIQVLLLRVREAVMHGEGVEAVLEQPLPEPYDAWSADGLPAEVSVGYLYELMSADDEEDVDSIRLS